MKQLRWRFVFIGLVTALAAYLVAPSIIYFAAPKEVRNSEEEMQKRIPDWLPQKHVSLGLDLQGGVQLVLGVNTGSAIENKLTRVGTEAQRWSDDNNAGIAKAYVLTGKGQMRIELKDGVDATAFRDKFRAEFPGFAQTGKSGNAIDYSYDEDQLKRIKLSAIEQAEKVVRNRVDKWGVSEPSISRRQADNSILVQLPGFKDPGKAKELLGRTAQLKFKLVDDKFDGFSALKDKLPAGITLTNNGGQTALQSEDRDALLKFIAESKVVPEHLQVYLHRETLASGAKARFTTYVVDAATEVGGDDVLDAFVSMDQQGLDQRPVVSMRFTGPGGKRFGDLTGANVGRRLAIVLDDIVESAPVIQSKIATGQGQITLGSGSYEQQAQEAQQLSLILKSGALPATIEVLEERQVGASLGPELADQGVKSVLLGLAFVLGYMVIYYRRPGVIASIALTLNGLFLLALMASFGFSLSLPGIAGFILTLGMAVDANVLINERIRQELAEGKNAKKAVENGFSKVFWTIFDANVTSLIAALVLLETNPAGPIRGFAVTLITGLVVSMFTALYCSRAFFDLAVSKIQSDRDLRRWLGGDLKEPKPFSFEFMKYGKMMTALGGLIALATIGMAGIRGVNWGVDFAGGTEMLVKFAEDVQPDEIQAVAADSGIRSVTLQALEGGRQQYLMRFGAEDFAPKEGETELSSSEQSARVQGLKEAITTKLASKKAEILSVDYVGPQIGKELRNQGVISIFYAIIGILLYIALRFDMRFGPGAVVKMLHDFFAMLAFYVFFWRSFDLTSVAAALTVIGYSVNDVIVVYDRIRENLTLQAKKPLEKIIDISLNETLIRSINTSVVTLISLIGILVFGTGQIWNFAMAMAVGVVAATFSSTFVASSCLLWFRNVRFGAGKPAPGSSATQPATTTAPAR
jgi:protein-export membrane protein SecD/preprotein translocase SecF subunit